MGQTVFWLKIGPITTFLDMDRGDRLPPTSPIQRPWSQGRPGLISGILGWGGGGPMYAIVYPALGPGPGPRARDIDSQRMDHTL